MRLTRPLRLAVLVAAGMFAAGLFSVVLVEKHQAIYASIARFMGTGQDMGRIDFATLQRRTTKTDALVCPPALCARAKPDWDAKTFAVTAAELRTRVMSIALAEPRTGALHCHPPCDGPDRYVQYSSIMRFPDNIDVQILPVGEDKSTIAIYSRSLLAYHDFGTNRARIARWLAALQSAP
jgi:uncharacterized protein (DUF1499 family)